MKKSPFYKKNEEVFAILGNAVVKCKVLTTEKVGDKHLQLEFKNAVIYKQKSYCFDTEIQALENLKDRLVKSLDIISNRISQLVTKELYKTRKK